MSTRVGAVLSVQPAIDELVETAKLHWTGGVYGFGEVVGELGAVDVRLVPGDLSGGGECAQLSSGPTWFGRVAWKMYEFFISAFISLDKSRPVDFTESWK